MIRELFVDHFAARSYYDSLLGKRLKNLKMWFMNGAGYVEFES